MINCGCKFTVFANNFNIKKGKFVLSFCVHRKGHVDMKGIQEFWKIIQVIIQLQEKKYIVNITSVKTSLNPCGNILNKLCFLV